MSLNVKNGPVQLNLPTPVANMIFTVKDVTGNFAVNAVTIHRFSNELIENLAADFVCEASYGSWSFACDGTNWFSV